MKNMIYLDYAAATPLDPEVLQVMLPYLQEQFFNPSALYLNAKAVHADVEHARQLLAQGLGARTTEIIFTGSGTESANLAIHGVMRGHPKGNVVVSAIEHEAVLQPARHYDMRIAPVDKHGIVDAAALETLVDDNTVLISVMYANNEVGAIQPIRDIAHMIQAKRKGRKQPLYLHTDAAQAGSYLDMHVDRLGVDLLSLNGSKLYGPKGAGALYRKTGVKLSPLIDGGGQEQGLRSGTENVAAIIGLAVAFTKAQVVRQTEAKRQRALQKLFIDELAVKLPQAQINGSLKHRLPNNIHVTIPGQDNERLLMALDEQGIMAAAGSACSASNEEVSHVLTAMGLSSADARASLRFTMGRQTTEADIRFVVATLHEIAITYTHNTPRARPRLFP